MEGTASYKKLRDGSWGIRTVGYIPDEGDRVEVTTKSGEVKNEEVSKLIWSGKQDDDQDTAICEIVPTDKDGNPVAKKQAGSTRQQGGGKPQQGAGGKSQQCKCMGCGTTDPAKQYYCSECVITGNTSHHPPADDSGSGGDDEIPF